ncbi:MAG: methyltransferase domain-containing protein [Chloroflexi bacterium]|nr:methyltransferase domain-containing protein [Chloroflexota bacterium]
MTRPQCCGIEQMFDDKTAQADLKTYLRKGPSKATRELIEQVAQGGVEGKRLLDIGGGVGIIQHELAGRGLARITHVDASTAYLKTAQEEAERRGHAGRADFRFGDLVELAPELEPADIVTLDRVICCYDDMPALVAASARLAKGLYAIVIPIDGRWVARGAAVANFFLKLFARTQYRMFIHSTQEIERILDEHGLRRSFYKRRGFWQVILYQRA